MTFISNNGDKTSFTISTIISLWSWYHLASIDLSFMSHYVMRYIWTIYNNKIWRILKVSMVFCINIKTAFSNIIFKIIVLRIFVKIIVICPLFVSLASPPTPLRLDNMQNPLNQKVPAPRTVGPKYWKRMKRWKNLM